MRHISVRVAWHDNKWNGTVCKCPIHNTFCSQLKRIAENKNPYQEDSISGKNWDSLNLSDIPLCIAETGGFMNNKKWELYTCCPRIGL